MGKLLDNANRIPKIKTYDVLSVRFSQLPYSNANGFYALIEKTDSRLKMCLIKNNGLPSLDKEGNYKIICSKSGNKEIHPTALKLVIVEKEY